MATNSWSMGLLGVPTSAGSHNPGQEKAPAAWRHAGLVGALRARGVDVEDYGDLPERRHQPTGRIDGVRDLDRVVAVARETSERVASVRAAGRRLLVLGGDCTVTIGVLAGMEASLAVGLVYFDGDVDLSSPATSRSGVLDTMGMTHMLGGGAPQLARLGPRPALLSPDRVVLFGFDPEELNTEQWVRLSSHNLYAVPAPSVRAGPGRCAREACSYLGDRVDALVVHFDVDVLDTGRFPLANFPHFAGLALEEASACLEELASTPKFAGLVITEVNPDHDPDGVLLRALTDVVADALAPRGGALWDTSWA